MSNFVEASHVNLPTPLDTARVASLMIESRIETIKNAQSIKAMDASPVDADFLDAVVELVKLLDTPAEIKLLAPSIICEIIYRLLRRTQGERLNHYPDCKD